MMCGMNSMGSWLLIALVLSQLLLGNGVICVVTSHSMLVMLHIQLLHSDLD